MLSNIPSFSYAITRPIPWRFYTPVVTISALFLLLALSLLNYAVNGFYLEFYETTNPNATQLYGWPHSGILSNFAKVKGNCQPKDIEVNDRFYTNQSGFLYLVTGVYIVQENKNEVVPSIKYLNNPLENCTIQGLSTQVDPNDIGVTTFLDGRSTWEFDTVAFATCYVTNDVARFSLDMQVTYSNTRARSTDDTLRFISPNNQTKASLWWGQSLMSWYDYNLNHAIFEYGNDTSTFLRGQIGNPFTRKARKSRAKSLDQYVNASYNNNIEDPAFLGYYFDFLFNGLQSLAAWHPPRWPDSASLPSSLATASDAFAKAFYSTLMVDLGSTTTANILNNAKVLQLYTNFSALASSVPLYHSAGPAQHPYNETSTGPLSICPSTISTEYPCQVPKRKPALELFVSILVADLVLMSTVWAAVKLVVAYVVGRRDKKAQYCQGCLETLERAGGEELVEEDASGLVTLLPMTAARAWSPN